MNKENLIPTNKRSKEEARELGKAGGIKSGETRRKKKMWKDIANAMLSTPTTEKNKEILKRYGIDDENADINAMIIYRLISQALDGKLDAIRELKEITGNKEADKLDLQLPIQLIVKDDYGD